MFKIFDSHSQDLHGMPSPSGYSVFRGGSKSCSVHLTSCSQNVCIPFEIKGVKCNKRFDLSNQRLMVQGKSKSDIQKKKRFCKRNYTNMIRHTESSQEKESRLAKQREDKRAQRKNESSDQREKRLAKLRACMKDRRNNESSQEREKRLAKKKSCNRQLVNEPKASSKNTCGNSNGQVSQTSVDSIAQLIRTFHNSVSTGPLYVCTCCEQLWYKHSVCPADRVRLVNPDIAKYLQNFKSVDNVEWLCNTCSNHLRKGKVPPCAIANGMKFPEKPNFFDLNKLECRLIAPRLAFQKIFQDFPTENYW